MSRVPPQNDDWLDQFKSSNLHIGLRLYLTKPMLEFLCATADDVYWDRGKYGGITFPDNWFATEHALRKRGLVRRKPPEAVKLNERRHPNFCELTPAGRAVVELLKVGGLFLRAEDAIEKMRSRKGRH